MGLMRDQPKEMGEILNVFFASVFTVETGMEATEIGQTSREVMEPLQIVGKGLLAVEMLSPLVGW